MYGINGDHGFIPLGKYSSARDSILYFLCVSEWSNDSDGNSEAPTGYFWRISNNPADVHIPNTEITSVLEEWFDENPEVTDSPELRQELEGHFIVSTNSQGFVYVEPFTTEAELLTEFAQRREQFYEWDSQDDD